MSELVKLIAVFNISLPSGKVKSGQLFDCPVELAEGYVDRGSARIPGDEDDEGVDGVEAETGGAGSGSRDATTLKLTDEEKAQAIRELLTGWLKEDPSQENETRWTKDGKPRNKSVDAALEFDAKNDEVQPIFAEVKKALEE